MTGAALLTHMAAIDYDLPISEPLYMRGGRLDLTTEGGRHAAELQIARDDPYVVTCSYADVLGTVWDRMAQGLPWNKVVEERKVETPMVKWIFKLARDRVERGRQFLFEHPWDSDLWNLAAVTRELEKPALDGGTLEAFEVVRATPQHATHEPYGYLTATLEVKRNLMNYQLRGPQPLPPPTPHGPWKAGDRDPEILEVMLEGLLESLDNLHSKTAFPAEADLEENFDEQPFSDNLDAITGPEDFVTGGEERSGYGRRYQEEELNIIAEEGPPQEQEAEEAKPLQKKRMAWRELGYGQRVALRRLHNMTGHASPAAMQRLLRTAGADPKVIKALEHFTCPTCDSLSEPKKAPATRMPSEYVFNYEVSLDVFFVKDCRGVKHKFLSIVDVGTLFHICAHVGTGSGPPSSGDCARVLQERWMSWAGAPRAVVMDRGCENRGRLQHLLRTFGVEIRYIGLESPFQLGRGERQGSILKSIMKHTISERQLHGVESMEMVATEGASIKNNRVHHGGFTPSQWVLGRMPLETDALTNNEADHYLGVHQEIHDGMGSFAKQLQIRNAARQAFAQTDSASRIRAAMLRKSTPARGPYVVGDLVCFYKRGGNRKGQGQGKWYGPARVIGHEGRSTLWIVHGGIPITVSNENCRYATGNEAIAKRMLELRPSRKRKREDEADDNPGQATYDYPFGDDLSGSSPSRAQRTYFDHSNEPVEPQASSEEQAGTDSTTEDLATAAGPPPGLQLPPGAIPVARGEAHEVPVPHSNSPGLSTPMSLAEPEHEIAPPSRHLSSGTGGGETEAAPPPITPLQAAMHRSLDNLDGIRTRRDERSRSPAPGNRRVDGEASPPPGERAFYAFLARRVCKKSVAAKAKELNFEKATGDQKEGMISARGSEWKNWQGFDAVEVLTPQQAKEYLTQNPDAEITPTRWVDTNKAQPWETPRYKARIVVRGDLEKDKGTRTDSPTCSSLMLNLIISYAASCRLRLHGGDITASFLQGEQMTRQLVLSPPKGGLPGVEQGSLLIANKPVYGTRDAPRGFWRRLHRVCKEKGLRPVPHEHAAYVLNGPDGSIEGMMVSHVDDLLWCGTTAMDRAMAEVQKEFKFGSLEHGDSFEYCGRTIEQGEKLGGIKVTCPNTASKVRGINLDGGRKHQKGARATPQEVSQLRSVVGSLNWVTRVCRPDIAYSVHRLQTVMAQATVYDLCACNQVLNYVKKAPDVGIYYKYEALDFGQMQIYSITDASHANDYDVSTNEGKLLGHRSQSGRFLLLGPPGLKENGSGTTYIIGYHSSVIRRVCRSTLQAETLSMLQGYEEAEHLRAVLFGLQTEPDDHRMVKAMDHKSIFMMTDCRSLEEHLRQAGLHTVGDKRLAIDLCGMRQMVWRHPGEEAGDPLYDDAPPENSTTQVIWIETKTMVADSLTKSMKCPQVSELMKTGNLVVDLDKTKSKKAGTGTTTSISPVEFSPTEFWSV